MAKKSSRFDVLKNLRQQRQEQEAPEEAPEETPETETLDEIVESEEPAADVAALVAEESKQPSEQKPKRKRGRPAGRRSDPNYTQISAYIPLDTLLAVQDELALERREKRQRTARPVSDLLEGLLEDWLKERQREKSE